ncbi:mechanosensitive ion channel [Patescibacteria group bacterium]|nr:mechanosensitive ion channel [Patescibacteria group bacterium]
MAFQNFLSSLISWFFSHGIKIVGILIVAFVATRLIKIFISRFLKNLIQKGFKTGKVKSIKLEEKRLETLEKVSFSILKAVIWIIAILTILPELGINIGPLLAGVGVGALALGLAARGLIQDYLSGLFILLEDQYRVGEEIEISGSKGKVKDFNLRRTVLEDNKGFLHYIPNGQIKKASNFSRK